MSFQAYLDTIKEKTGLGPGDFRAIAAEKGLLADDVKPAQIVAWLADDYGLGRGHAMALVATFRESRAGGRDPVDVVDKQFTGAKAHWRATYDDLLLKLAENGHVDIAPTNTYISLLKGTAKFAIVAVTADRLDIGIKLKGVEPIERFEASGPWNSMVTHRVRISDPTQIDADVLDWLRRAYDAA
ncbi:DUF4287 domain-containing protein [Glaciihabitans sp. dw_435]|uniref:DUF4287 domain-containing protein n=1 Tax=Glaciihabitans sp. dw_435 TaxID=2720081 RepID=UPI001BD52E05|nr:DUF4287 domain-containing protein [Glaciihabitans sp. dw_435]